MEPLLAGRIPRGGTQRRVNGVSDYTGMGLLSHEGCTHNVLTYIIGKAHRDSDWCLVFLCNYKVHSMYMVGEIEALTTVLSIICAITDRKLNCILCFDGFLIYLNYKSIKTFHFISY